jgi:hypothetical protein
MCAQNPNSATSLPNTTFIFPKQFFIVLCAFFPIRPKARVLSRSASCPNLYVLYTSSLNCQMLAAEQLLPGLAAWVALPLMWSRVGTYRSGMRRPGAHLPWDTMTKGCIGQGTCCQMDTLSQGWNIWDFLFWDTLFQDTSSSHRLNCLCLQYTCRVDVSPTDVSPTENSWMLRPLNKASLGYCVPDRCVPTLDRVKHGTRSVGRYRGLGRPPAPNGSVGRLGRLRLRPWPGLLDWRPSIGCTLGPHIELHRFAALKRAAVGSQVSLCSCK